MTKKYAVYYNDTLELYQVTDKRYLFIWIWDDNLTPILLTESYAIATQVKDKLNNDLTD